MVNTLVELFEHGGVEEEPDAVGEEEVGLRCQYYNLIQVILFSGRFLVSF